MSISKMNPRARKELQVFYSIICGVSVDVVNHLFRSKWSPQKIGHYLSVFRDATILIGIYVVTVIKTYIAPALKLTLVIVGVISDKVPAVRSCLKFKKVEPLPHCNVLKSKFFRYFQTALSECVVLGIQPIFISVFRCYHA